MITETVLQPKKIDKVSSEQDKPPDSIKPYNYTFHPDILGGLTSEELSMVAKIIIRNVQNACYRFYLNFSLQRAKFDPTDPSSTAKLFETNDGTLPTHPESLMLQAWLTRIFFAYDHQYYPCDATREFASGDIRARHLGIIKVQRIASDPNYINYLTFYEYYMRYASSLCSALYNDEGVLHIRELLEMLSGLKPVFDLYALLPQEDQERQQQDQDRNKYLEPGQRRLELAMASDSGERRRDGSISERMKRLFPTHEQAS